jgi:23S rRNA (adenine2503-C2)-methyltransferase
MPIANHYTLAETLDACRYYFEKTHRRVTFEYSLVKGVNDTAEHAKRLAALLGSLHGHVNLIPVNPIDERDYRKSDQESVQLFKNILERNRINVTIRRSMGRDIDAACGQLRRRAMQEQDEKE